LFAIATLHSLSPLCRTAACLSVRAMLPIPAADCHSGRVSRRVVLESRSAGWGRLLGTRRGRRARQPKHPNWTTTTGCLTRSISTQQIRHSCTKGQEGSRSVLRVKELFV